MSMTGPLEIVQLKNGDICLSNQASGEGAEPFLSVRFSAKAQAMLNDKHSDIAKLMLKTGLHFADQVATSQENTDHDAISQDRVLH